MVSIIAYNYIIWTSIEARLRRASPLRRAGNGASVIVVLWQRFPSIIIHNLFAPMVYPVMMVLQAKASKGPWQWSIDSHAMSVLPATVHQMHNEVNNLI